MKKIVLSAVASVCFVFSAAVCHAMDWKALHEEADHSSVGQALTEVQRAPDSAEALYILGLVYLNDYKLPEAKEAFEKILLKEKGDIGARWELAEILRRQHKLGECQQLLEAIVKEDPTYAPGPISLGYALYERKDYERSILSARQVLKLGQDKVDLTDTVRAHLIIGGAKGMIAYGGGPFSKLINGAQALPYLKSAERLMPDFPGVLFGLGSFYLLAPSLAGGNKDKGFAYLERAEKADPLFVDVYARLAQGYIMRGDLRKAREYLGKALALDPGNALALDVQKKLE